MSIKIISGKRGWHLRIDGHYISHGFKNQDQISVKAIAKSIGIPYGATEWVSVRAIRNFWNKYRVEIIQALQNPFLSINGNLIPQNITPSTESAEQNEQ